MMKRASILRGLAALLLVCCLAVFAQAQTPSAPKKKGKGKKAAKTQKAAAPAAGGKAALVAAGERPTTLTAEMIAAFVKEQKDLLAAAPEPTIDTTLAKMRAACDWQLDHLYNYIDKKTGKPDPKRGSDTDWVRGAFFTGVMGAYYTTTDYRFYLAAKSISEKNNWLCGPRPRHADDRTIAQTYLELYLLEGKKDPKQIESVKAKYDAMMASEQPGRVDWWWCDALYMDPPTLTRLAAATGEKKYLDYMSKMYWDATAFLYDKDEHLFYRDSKYFGKAEKNGRKIFWSRGDGWVFGGLCRVLDFMPKDYPDRPKFEALFKEMAAAIVKTQGEQGLWHSSLLDPVSYPLGETSGSGFYTYGLAWGINNGLLDRAATLPAVQKGWKALMACVDDASGKLQYVQFIGADPQLIKKTDNMEYGTGSFLLAGGQMLKLMAGEAKGKAAVSAANPLGAARASETIELPWAKLAAQLPGLLPSRVRVSEGGKPVLPQVTYEASGPAALIFQADFQAKETKNFEVTLSDEPLASAPVSKTFGRFVPERLDDFAWENDRIAHRVYGTGLQTQDLAGKDYMISSGIDVWSKRVRTPVINHWYATGKYHEDAGEGCDNYKVDFSRGCGGIGIWAGGTLVSSENFDKTKWRVLANGPIRTTFELVYNPWDVAGRKFAEVKRVSLDAGVNMSHVVSRFETTAAPFQAGIGLTETNGKGTLVKDAKAGILAYWEEPDAKGKGSIATAAIVPPAQVVGFEYVNKPRDKENLMIVNADPAKPVDYYIGAGWSKSGDFADAQAWQAYVEAFAKRVAAPIEVK